MEYMSSFIVIDRQLEKSIFVCFCTTDHTTSKEKKSVKTVEYPKCNLNHAQTSNLLKENNYAIKAKDHS